MTTNTFDDLENVLKLVLPVLLATNPQVGSIVGIVGLICLVVEEIVKEYKSRKASQQKSISSTQKSDMASQVAGQIIDVLHQNKIIGDALAFDAKAVIGLESVFRSMITDIISIMNKDRLAKSLNTVSENSCCCICWPWKRSSKKVVYSATLTLETNNK
jgi:hypothetical protein